MNNNLSLEQIKKQNEIVFKKCYEQFYEELVVYANRYLFDYDLSEDLVQEVFIYLWENSKSIEIKISIKAYLYIMVKNKCLNYLKSLKITDNQNCLELSDGLYNECFDKDSLKTHDVAYSKVMKIVDNMPLKMQQIFKLKFLSNYKYREISEELNISINTVKTQLKRAKNKISKSCTYFF